MKLQVTDLSIIQAFGLLNLLPLRVLFHFISLGGENPGSTTYEANQGRCTDKYNPRHFQKDGSGGGMAFTAKGHRLQWLDAQYPAAVGAAFSWAQEDLPEFAC